MIILVKKNSLQLHNCGQQLTVTNRQTDGQWAMTSPLELQTQNQLYSSNIWEVQEVHVSSRRVSEAGKESNEQ